MHRVSPAPLVAQRLACEMEHTDPLLNDLDWQGLSLGLQQPQQTRMPLKMQRRFESHEI